MQLTSNVHIEIGWPGANVGYVTTGLYDEDLAPPVSAAENGDPQEIID